jgi:hypothetical protein
MTGRGPCSPCRVTSSCHLFFSFGGLWVCKAGIIADFVIAAMLEQVSQQPYRVVHRPASPGLNPPWRRASVETAAERYTRLEATTTARHSPEHTPLSPSAARVILPSLQSLPLLTRTSKPTGCVTTTTANTTTTVTGHDAVFCLATVGHTYRGNSQGHHPSAKWRPKMEKREGKKRRDQGKRRPVRAGVGW